MEDGLEKASAYCVANSAKTRNEKRIFMIVVDVVVVVVVVSDESVPIKFVVAAVTKNVNDAFIMLMIRGIYSTATDEHCQDDHRETERVRDVGVFQLRLELTTPCACDVEMRGLVILLLLIKKNPSRRRRRRRRRRCAAVGGEAPYDCSLSV
jgi:hypothetical protein